MKVIKIRLYTVGHSTKTGDILKRLGQSFYVKESNPFFKWYKKQTERGIYKIVKEFEV